MEKSIYTREYGVALRLLRTAREASGMTQVQLAKALGQSQSFVSKVELGDRRLDVIQLRTLLHKIGLKLPEFVLRLEAELTKKK
jgi:transcriptional regulator with XRE-family HTH domain